MIRRFINRILILSVIILVVSFTLIASFLYKKTNDVVINFIETSIHHDLNTLGNIIIDQEELANKEMLYRIKIVNNLINSQIITLQPFNSQIPVLDINTKEENIAILSPIFIGHKPIDETFVKYVKFLSNTNIAVVQKFQDGYVITYSDIDDFKKQGYKYFFSKNSDVSIYIDNKQTFVKKIQIKNKTYKMGIVPIFIGKDIVGAVLLLRQQWFSDKFKSFFESQIYLKHGYPLLLDEHGALLLHPLLEGENIKNTNIFYKILLHKDIRKIVKIQYRWPETPSGKQKIIYVKYLPQYDYFIAISVLKEDFYTYTKQFKVYYLASVVLSLIVSLFFIIIVETLLLQRINNVRTKFEELSLGIIPEKIKIKGDNYIAIEKTYNKIVDNFYKYTKFAHQLSEGNYQYKFNPVSNQDALGYELVKIRQHLETVHKDIEQREQEEKIRAWRNAGIEKFINILSRREQELSKWSFQIIKTAVEYLQAFQGGLFILEQDTDNPELEYFTLISCYAFNEEKIIKRKIPVYTGLFAKLYKTPQILYIQELEEDYQIITSALGQVKPRAIVLVPLIYNNILIGAMEIDSFNKLEKYQLDFLEEIAGHISANLSSWRVTKETETILKRYHKQNEEFNQKQNELQEKIQQLANLNTQYKNLEKEYKTAIALIDQFAYRAELDEHGKIISANDKLAALYEKDNSYFIGKYISEFTGFDIINPEYKEKWEQILKGEIINTIENISIDEKNIWMHEYFVAIKDTNKQLKKILLIALDITETKMLERQLRIQVKEISKETRLLRREERKLRKEKEEFEKQKKHYELLLSLYDKTFGLIQLNKNKIIVHANDWIAKILLYEPEEMINQSFENFLLQAEKNKFEQNFKRALENKEVSDAFQLLRKDENSIKLTIHLFFQEDKKDQFIYLIIRP